mmetsp:Transcript_36266/g.58467  ORF Transcript_36266/g.58467 Transcript_36266/m.58467 type:complete len:109 (-) Transcript_36266:76-402(-)
MAGEQAPDRGLTGAGAAHFWLGNLRLGTGELSGVHDFAPLCFPPCSPSSEDEGQTGGASGTGSEPAAPASGTTFSNRRTARFLAGRSRGSGSGTPERVLLCIIQWVRT